MGLLGLRHTKLSLIRQVAELLRLSLLVLGFRNVLFKVSDESTVEVLTVADSTLVDLGQGQGRVLPDSEDVVAEVSDPKSAQFLILRTRLLCESGHEATTRDACSISHRPTLILKAVDESVK